LVVVLRICGLIGLAVAGSAWGADTYDGTYTGTRLLTKGPDQTCPGKEDVSVTIHGETLTFTNGSLRNEGIMFDPRPDGSFGEISAGTGGSVVLIRGHMVGDVIEADVTNGPCEHHWHLKKQSGQ
jgi:hypothetical protein